MNTTEAAEALKDLYDIIEKSKKRKLVLPKDVIRQINEIEEGIIRNEILSAMSKDIEPRLSAIKRDLVLVVEYHPGQPISVALSRKMKINQITDAKTITPVQEKVGEPVVSTKKSSSVEPHVPTKQVVNHTKGLRVQFPDGTVICRTTAIETLKASLRRIGLQRVHDLNIQHSGYNLVSKQKRPSDGQIWQHELDGWYIYSNTTNLVKINDLRFISDKLHLGLKVDVAK